MLIHGNLKRVMKIIIEDNYEPNMVYIFPEFSPYVCQGKDLSTNLGCALPKAFSLHNR